MIVLSNDADTFALLLHYIPLFNTLGLEEIWQQYGTGEKRRMLPLHQAVIRLGTPLARAVIKAHILTGNDCMSKIGTKNAAITANPVHYLARFGETDCLSDEDEHFAEEYLVHVCAGARTKTKARTFDQLREERYSRGLAGIDSLPPTSSVVQGHIRRAAFLVHKACTLLLAYSQQREDYLKPLKHGWAQHFGVLIPSTFMRSLPTALLTLCKCNEKCDTLHCLG